MAKEKVLIVGGGFGGVKTALGLVDDDRFEVTLLSDSAELRYYPTLYHTATGGSRRGSSVYLESIFARKSIKLEQGSAASLDRKAKMLSTKDGKAYPYDTLVLALGVVTNYFGIKGLPEYSYSIKTQDEVHRFKAHLHKQLIEEKHPDPHYVIVGAGPTGIELAGALPAYLRQIMRNHGIKNRQPRVEIIEALPRLLPRSPKKSSRAVRRRLKRLGVKIYLSRMVQGETADELTVSGKPIRSHTVVWTAGVTNHPFFKDNGFALMKNGKTGVDAFLQAEPAILVIGDNANTPYSGLAQTAIHDGGFVASNLRRGAAGKGFKSYDAKKPISVIPVGKNWASVQWGKLTFNGRLGWLLREAGDLVGFHDLEPWPKAFRQYLHEFQYEDDCEICAVASK